MKKTVNLKRFTALAISFIFLIMPCSTVRAASNADTGFVYMFEDTKNFVYISWDFGKGHSGINITSASYENPILKTPIKSVCDGKVVYLVNNHATAGNYVVIENSDNIKVSYMLMDKPTPLKVGDMVEKGETIVGYVGRSGNATGPNLLISIFKTEPNDTNRYWARANTSMDPKTFFPDIDFVIVR